MDIPTPEVTPLNEPYWMGLREGVLRFQQCRRCGHKWLPARRECPSCLADDTVWEPSAGRGKVVSWIVYHTAYHEAFKDRLPYNVAIIELQEGPRLMSNVLAPHAEIRADMPVQLRIEQEAGIAIPRFAPAAAT